MAKKKQLNITGKVVATDWVAENGYPAVGTFTDKKVLQKFYKQLPTEVLEDWCAKEGLEYKPCTDNDSIHRMRVAMAILYLHFPKETKAKPKSKYADYTLEQLVDMALEHSVAVEMTDDTRILRMRLIMGLRASKVID